MKSTWPPESYTSPHAETHQLELPLPPRPGILRPVVCPRCSTVHVSLSEKRDCQQAAWKEQA